MATWRVFETMMARDFELRLRIALATCIIAGFIVGFALGAWLL